MTKKMLLALSAAAKADPSGGLCYTVAGFVDPKNCWEYHSFLTCSALEQRGYLWRYGKGKQRKLSITARGMEALQEAQEAAAS